MNNKAVNVANKALEAVMNAAAPLHSLGENAFTSMQVHHFRSRVDATDDQLREEQKRLTWQLLFVNDPQKRSELIEELREVIDVRDKLEAIDDQLHAKDGKYKRAVSKFFDRAYKLTKQASSSLDQLASDLSKYFSKKKRAVS